jgi:hypothetical protein
MLEFFYNLSYLEMKAMNKERVCANGEAAAFERKKYHAYRLPCLFEAISMVLADSDKESWQKDVSIATAIADVAADYADRVVDELDRAETRAILQSVEQLHAKREV